MLKNIDKNILLFSSRFLKQKEYWTTKLSGDIAETGFPFQHRDGTRVSPGDEDNDKQIRTAAVVLPPELSAQLISLSKESNLSIYIILLAGLKALLYRYTGSEDISILSPVHRMKVSENTINEQVVIRDTVDGDLTFKALILKIRQSVLEAYANQDYPFEKLVEFLIANSQIPASTGISTIGCALDNIHGDIIPGGVREQLHISLRREDRQITGDIIYNPQSCEKYYVEELSRHLIELLKNAVKNLNIKISEVSILSGSEKKRLLVDFNDTAAALPGEKTLHRLFEEQAEKTPGNTALVSVDGTPLLSYRQLEKKANQAAHILKAKGLGPGKIAAIITHMSPAAVAVIFGILKAGGAYLPISPEYPDERINFMLENSGVDILVSDGSKKTAVRHSVHIVDIHDPLMDSAAKNNPVSPVNPRDIAYLIYTSGTTGRPKGVLVGHRGAVNTLTCRKRHYNMNGEDTALQLFSYSFDGFVTSLFTPLISGSRVVLMSEEEVRDIMVIQEAIVKNNVTHFISIPTLYLAIIEHLSPAEASSLKIVTLAGDKVDSRALKVTVEKNPGLEIVNEYGVTEGSIMSTIYRHQESEADIKIGKPIDNTRAYILDKFDNILPPGIPGELSIAGAGVARGYINNPQLTGEKFKNDPFFRGQRLYRTGDLARWLPNGDIQIIGRIDHQVKIRGFRIELTEIENRLMTYPGIKEAMVVIKSVNENKYLCAYFVSGGQPSSAALEEHLSRDLPDYMIPSYFVKLDQLPVTPGGKLDRESLSEPEGAVLARGAEYEAPTNAVEEKMAAIWENVLGRDKVGINENFFMIGGDSIKSIQIASRMTMEGYRVEMKDLFQNPTIAKLAPYVKRIERVVSQSIVSGTIPLTPIQEAFFREFVKDPHHNNQAVMLYSGEKFEQTILEAVFKKIQDHHDALRMTYTWDEEDGIVQTNHGLEYPFFFKVYDFQGQDNAVEGLETEANRIQASIDLETGPLMKTALFRLDDGDRLLIVIHHLVVDTVSWRILFEDIAALYRQGLNGESLSLPLKTDSFKVWSEKLTGYADSPAFLMEKQYWKELESGEIPSIKTDVGEESNTRADIQRESVSLSDRETEQLLTTVNNAFGTEINDILLTALGPGIRDTFGLNRMLIALEGHGREEILEDVDINRTVGWFTSVYPVLLDVSHDGSKSPEENMVRRIKEVKESLRRVPQKGIGYGILKYLTAPRHKKEIEFTLSPQISFNYLGQFDEDLEQTVFQVARESVGCTVSPNAAREYELDVSGMMAGKRLVISVDYSGKRFKKETIRALLNRYKEELCRVIAFCAAREERELTPSDLTYPGLSIETLEHLCRRYPVEDIYRLSPMQEGMLFHALYEERSSAYFVQISYRLQGCLDLSLVEKSLNRLLKRHHVLRTVFVHEGLDFPVQLVLKDRKIDFYYEDIRETATGNSGGKESLIKAFKEKDRIRSFDLSRDVLMRVSVLQTGDTEYEFVWSQHHILMDGWCTGILISEFFEIYSSYLEQRPSRLPGVKPYRTYIQWLEKQDMNEAQRYWASFLEDYEELTGIPQKRSHQQRGRGYKKEQVTIQLDREVTDRLNRLAAKNQVTLNTVVQSVWGIILGNYNRKCDTLFGAVVSGRPSEIEGMESMVGLFINTLPVRVHYEEGTTFTDLLQRVQAAAIEAETYQYYPLAMIQAHSSLKQNLFDHIMVFENYPIKDQVNGVKGIHKDRPRDEAFRVSGTDVFEQTTYDFYLVILPAFQLTVGLSFNGCVYDIKTIERMTRHIENVFRQASADDRVVIDTLTLLPREEQERLLYEFNNTTTGYPGEKTVHGLFEEQVEKTPHRIALVEADGEITLSYRQLYNRTHRAAALLKTRGITPDTIVGMILDKSSDMVAAILGILMAGGAYLPIDPEYPPERIQYMLTDSGANLLLSDGSELSELNVDIEVIDLVKNMANTREDSPFQLAQRIYPDHLAYIIYTSGTTGKPKGVMIEHKNVVRLMFNDDFLFDFNKTDVWTMFHASNFDFSVWEMYGALLYGGKLILIPRMIARDPFLYLRILKQQSVTVLNQTPSAFYNLAEEELTHPVGALHIRYVIFGGEALSPGRLKAWHQRYPGTKLVNMFGITETTVHVTYKEIGVPEITAGISNIGTPIPTLGTYVMDDRLRLLPIGVPGECCVAGDGVGRGYLNREALTVEKFATNPYKPGERLYRSGDLVRLLENGEMEYLGRIDHQVKIRGFRIELGEIQSELLKHDDIKEAVVIDRSDENENRSLSAYIVPIASRRRSLSVSRLREYLAHNLPDYMIPAYFVLLEQIPLTRNGKIDRKALPEPEIGVEDRYLPPRNELEESLVNVWGQVLGLEKVGIKDGYFDVGGDSIKAITLLNRINNQLNVKLKIVDLFVNDTIEKLAVLVSGGNVPGTGGAAGEDREDSADIARRETLKEIEDLKERIVEENRLPYPGEIEDIYPMSDIEKGMVFHSLKETEVPVYHDQMVRQVKYPAFSPERFNKALMLLVEKHPILRTGFNMEEFEEAVQIVYSNIDIDMEYENISHMERQQQQEYIKRILAEDRKKTFNVSKPPLWRCRTFTLDNTHVVVLWICHHAILDGWSDASLMTELNNTYLRLKTNPDYIPQRLKNTYKEFIIEQLTEKKQQPVIDYWKNELKDYKRFEFFGTVRKDSKAGVVKRRAVNLGIPLLDRLKEVARKYNSSVKNLCFAAHAIMLNMLSSQDDMVVGLITNNRPLCEDGENIVGCFLNTVPVRIVLPSEDSITWADYIRMVDWKLVTLKRYERLSLFEIARITGEEAGDRNPILDTTFNYIDFHIYREAMADNTDREKQEPSGRSLPLEGYINTNALFDFNIETTFDGFSNFIYYDTSVIHDSLAVNLMGYFRAVLDKFIYHEDDFLQKEGLISIEEKQTLLEQFNRAETPYSSEKTICELFETQVEKTPAGTAVVYEREAISYDWLEKMANQLGNYLVKGKQVRVEDRVGIIMNPCPDFITAILGILKAGAVYIPIDPSLPEERLKRIINDAGIQVVISRKEFIRTLNRVQWSCPSFHTFLCMDSENIYMEEEREKSERMDEKLWKYIGETATDDITGGGWFTSYTGNPFPKAEMDEFGENVLKKLSPLLHKEMTVLEIGCATGLTMFRVAPRVALYYGTDLSSVIIERTKERVRKEGHRNIELLSLPAHEIGQIRDKTFDLVIINSVIQSFHGHNYLRKVIRECIRKLNPEGCLFIGDIMDLDLKQNLEREMIEFKIANRGKNYKTKTDWSVELFVPRAFFEDLRYEIPGIRDIEFSRKIHIIENELTKFRYDALIKLDKTFSAGKTHGTKQKYQDDLKFVRTFDDRSVPSRAAPHHSLYVIYTSGTTGTPKGVIVENRNLVNYVTWFGKTAGIDETDKTLLTSSPTFDLGNTLIYSSLLNGAELHLVSRETLLSVESLLDYIQANRVTYMKMTPSFFTLILGSPDFSAAVFKSLRLLLMGGEAINLRDVEKVKRLCPFTRIMNHYGPTETTIGSVAQFIDFESSTDTVYRTSIGTPIHNTRLYILDKRFAMTPLGVPGELVIGGHGVGRGYMNNPTQTSQRFVGDPFIPGETVYRTGDLARWLFNGSVDFLGRIDQQVKVRGFRIELEGIESQMQNHYEIDEAVVVVRETGPGDKQLCAYYVSETEVDVSELREYLSDRLPDYMIPAYFMQLEKMPLNPNGKLDRAALPDPGAGTAGETYVPPRNRLDRQLIEIWSEVLGMPGEMIGINENFFELGGHSLKVITLVMKIHKELNVKIPLAEIFQASTVRELSDNIENASADNFFSINAAEEKEYYDLSSAQKRMFVVHRMEPESTTYNKPMVMVLEGRLDRERLMGAFYKLIDRHEILRTSFIVLAREPVQKVHKTVELVLEDFELGEPGEMQDPKAEQFIKAFVRPFDLDLSPLLRVGLIKTGETRHILMVDMYHIVSDGVSSGLLISDFTALYNNETLRPLRLQYKDFSEWQNRMLRSGEIDRQEDFWLDRFSGEIPALNLPTDSLDEQEHHRNDGDAVPFTLNNEMTSRLHDAVRETGTTTYMLLLAVFNVLLSKYTKQDDIVVGSPIAGRRHPDLENIIGMFVNMLAMRNRPEENKTFGKLLAEVKQNSLDAFENQDYQFEELVRKLGVRDHINASLCNVVFVLQDMQSGSKQRGIEDLKITPYSFENRTAKFDLQLEAVEYDGFIRMELNYSLALFKRSTVEKLRKHYIEILEQVLDNREIIIKDISISHDLLLAKSDVLQGEQSSFGF